MSFLPHLYSVAFSPSLTRGNNESFRCETFCYLVDSSWIEAASHLGAQTHWRGSIVVSLPRTLHTNVFATFELF